MGGGPGPRISPRGGGGGSTHYSQVRTRAVTAPQRGLYIYDNYLNREGGSGATEGTTKQMVPEPLAILPRESAERKNARQKQKNSCMILI